MEFLILQYKVDKLCQILVKDMEKEIDKNVYNPLAYLWKI